MKKAITSIVVGLIGLSPVGVMAAQPQDKDLKDHGILLSVVEGLGIPVNFDGQLCRERPTWYGGYEIHGNDFSLCSRGDKVDRLNTVRHESWHVYQDLKDCNIKDSGMTAAFSNGPTPRMYKDFAAKYYEPEDIQLEAEAYWAADTFDAQTIANLIYQKATECGYKFKF
jgi:hypothetical protein